MNFRREPNRIFAMNQNGQALGVITFPELQPGVFEINNTVVIQEEEEGNLRDVLISEAVKTIRERGGQVTATCPFAAEWLEKNG